MHCSRARAIFTCTVVFQSSAVSYNSEMLPNRASKQSFAFHHCHLQIPNSQTKLCELLTLHCSRARAIFTVVFRYSAVSYNSEMLPNRASKQSFALHHCHLQIPKNWEDSGETEMCIMSRTTSYYPICCVILFNLD